eukprot:3142198-Pleurochrysis_carterae.AAC.3
MAVASRPRSTDMSMSPRTKVVASMRQTSKNSLLLMDERAVRSSPSSTPKPTLIAKSASTGFGMNLRKPTPVHSTSAADAETETAGQRDLQPSPTIRNDVGRAHAYEPAIEKVLVSSELEPFHRAEHQEQLLHKSGDGERNDRAQSVRQQREPRHARREPAAAGEARLVRVGPEPGQRLRGGQRRQPPRFGEKVWEDGVDRKEEHDGDHEEGGQHKGLLVARGGALHVVERETAGDGDECGHLGRRGDDAADVLQVARELQLHRGVHDEHADRRKVARHDRRRDVLHKVADAEQPDGGIGGGNGRAAQRHPHRHRQEDIVLLWVGRRREVGDQLGHERHHQRVRRDNQHAARALLRQRRDERTERRREEQHHQPAREEMLGRACHAEK